MYAIKILSKNGFSIYPQTFANRQSAEAFGIKFIPLAFEVIELDSQDDVVPEATGKVINMLSRKVITEC